MKKRISIGILAMALLLNGCNAETTEESSTQSTSSGQPETEVSSEPLTESMGENEESAENSDNSSPGQSQNSVNNVEDSKLRLIDCHQLEDDGEQFTYLAFALLGPKDIGFHLEGGSDEISEAWLASYHMAGGWRVVTCKELPGGITPENLSLSVTDYSTSEEKTVLLNDWGEPMSKEELQTAGIYEIEGHLAIVNGGSPATTTSSDQYGFTVPLGLVGAEYGNPEIYFPSLENPEELFHFYAADGTPLEESIGQKIEEFTAGYGGLKVWFELSEGMDEDAALEKLVEEDPYMEYTNADGETFQFPLALGN